MEANYEPLHVEVMIHEAMKGSLNEKEFRRLDPQSQKLVRTIHKRYRKRVNAENELRKMRRNTETTSLKPENFIFSLLADYAIDLAIRREERQPAPRDRHKERLARLWHEYASRVLRFS